MSNTGLWWVKNVVLRVTRRKKFKMFPYAVSFSCAFDEKFIEVPWFLVLLFFFFFAKRWVLYFWQCSEYFSLNNCSVTCTGTLYYVLLQTYSEFWCFQLSLIAVICPHILRTLSYSELWHIYNGKLI